MSTMSAASRNSSSSVSEQRKFRAFSRFSGMGQMSIALKVNQHAQPKKIPAMKRSMDAERPQRLSFSAREQAMNAIRPQSKKKPIATRPNGVSFGKGCLLR